MQIAITGANSSVGETLLRHIAELGDVDARAGVRAQQAIQTLPSAPRITPAVIRYDRAETLASLVEGVSCLVHVAGVLFETKTSTYQTANVDVTQAVVEACRRARVNHIILVSALGADDESPNRYYRSKGAAERIVTHSGTSATIIRTPILLGPGTAGAESLVRLASRESVKVLGGGTHVLRPLDVDDLCRAILRCCDVQANGVAVHELVGPEPTTHRDLIAAAGRRMGNDVAVGAIPLSAAKLGATLAGLAGRRGMTRDVIDVITAHEDVTRNADVDLGVSLTPLSVTLDRIVPDHDQMNRDRD